MEFFHTTTVEFVEVIVIIRVVDIIGVVNRVIIVTKENMKGSRTILTGKIDVHLYIWTKEIVDS
jgi:hypothetical protein